MTVKPVKQIAQEEGGVIPSLPPALFSVQMREEGRDWRDTMPDVLFASAEIAQQWIDDNAANLIGREGMDGLPIVGASVLEIESPLARYKLEDAYENLFLAKNHAAQLRYDAHEAVIVRETDGYWAVFARSLKRGG